MIDFKDFYRHLAQFGLEKHSANFKPHIEAGMDAKRHGDLTHWLNAFAELPKVDDATLDIKTGVSVSSANGLSEAQQNHLDASLRALIPWRKGPFHLFDTHIDTEWRSDWKWDRVLPHLSPLAGRKVLDVGCGSGYHCWRMLGEGADWVLGIDPSPRFVVQFEMLKHFSQNCAIDVVPLGIEHLPSPLDFFDTTFSMGVFYHRSSPIDHLKELRATLKPGGELVLETLVIDGELGQCLVPDDRYAQMRNVWFLPSVATLLQWMQRCGFDDARCVDICQTSTDEQRSTEWMPNHSLQDFLDPKNQNLTIEGLPAPKRAVIVAKRSRKMKR